MCYQFQISFIGALHVIPCLHRQDSVTLQGIFGGKLSDWSFFVWREGIFNTTGQFLEGSEVIGQGFEDLQLGGIFVGEVLTCSCTCWGVVVCGVGSYACISLN